ncbi:glycosyltransferase family 1 protein [Georgenia sp. MJ206]|uniref:glycosyltransferase family 1 protein n=1 Tax=Georgenia wangjunii TaxID=3117730 RepID=UPI002F269BFF
MSFSYIHTDPRVLKQIRHFAMTYDVVTCGYGQAPPDVVRHLEIPISAPNGLNGRYITLRAYQAAYSRQLGVRYARSLVSGLDVDVAIANDIEAVPIALSASVHHGVLADMHEYFPRWREENELWKRRIGPYYAWLCRKYLARARRVSTVSSGLAREYTSLIGTDVAVVRNATPYHDLTPTPVGEPIRLVHSGLALRRRHLELIIEAVGRLAGKVELDLYLVKSDPSCHADLEMLAASTTNVTMHDPVPYDELIPTLNEYDVGIHVIPAVSFNNRWALPNKFFDYVQARLGIAIGPSPEMAGLVDEHRLGVVADGFTVDDVERMIVGLDGPQISAYKAAAHASARELSADTEVAKWDAMISSMIES